MVSRAFALTLLLSCAPAGASSGELIHPYPATGPFEVAGTPPAATKLVRTMQRYAMPAFTDVLATHIANALQSAAGEPFKVVRKSRQSGKEALDAVAKAAGDGRTLLLAMRAPNLRGVARVAVMPYVFAVRADSRYTDVGELIAQGRGASGRLLAASAGEANVSHVALRMLGSQHDLRTEPVAYNGGLAALQALVTKEVSAALVPLPSAMPYVGGGSIRILKSGAAHIDVTDAFYVFAPPGTPDRIISELNVAIARSLIADDARETFAALGIRLDYRAPGTRSP